MVNNNTQKVAPAEQKQMNSWESWSKVAVRKQ